MEEIKIAIIGGTGIYEQEEFKIIEKIDLVTPYGRPSAPLSICEINKQKIIFLPRHGERHNLPPHKVNYRANRENKISSLG